jgi:prepilin peptidase CpaA
MIHILQTLVLLVFPLLVIGAALRDVVSYTIPNWISLALVAGFPVAALAFGVAIPMIGLHLAIGVGALVVGMGMFAAGWIGGGDAKLFAATALWLGWPATLNYLAVTGLGGGALAVGLLALRAPVMRPFVCNGPAWFVRLAEPGENVPYGVAIAVGALFAFPASTLMQAWGGL